MTIFQHSKSAMVSLESLECPLSNDILKRGLANTPKCEKSVFIHISRPCHMWEDALISAMSGVCMRMEAVRCVALVPITPGTLVLEFVPVCVCGWKPYVAASGALVPITASVCTGGRVKSHCRHWWYVCRRKLNASYACVAPVLHHYFVFGSDGF
jgi:hypothetical protein